MDADPAHDPPATAPDAPRRACVRAHVASESDPGAAALVRGAVAAPASPDVLILPASVPLPEGVDANASEFDPARYFAELRASALGRVLLTARVLPSTQTLVSDNTAAAPGEVIPRGALVVADSQTGGRGRGGNAWTSPPGCLTFSLLARHAEGRTLPFLQYVATMAAVEAIQDAARVSFPAPRRGGKASASADASVLDVRVKWPNDLYSGGQKIGGVLCASTYADGAFDVVVGVGINLDNPAPTTCVNHIIEAARRDRGVDADAVPFAPVTREALAARFATRFEALARVVAETRGFEAIEAAYLNMWMHTGQEVTLIEEDEEGGEGREVRLRIEGLTRDGYLLAKDGGGRSSSTRTGTASTFSRGSSGKNSRAGRRRRVFIEHNFMTNVISCIDVCGITCIVLRERQHLNRRRRAGDR